MLGKRVIEVAHGLAGGADLFRLVPIPHFPARKGRNANYVSDERDPPTGGEPGAALRTRTQAGSQHEHADQRFIETSPGVYPLIMNLENRSTQLAGSWRTSLL
jgi:hypothetical protein